jgi:hypothetical protein
MKQTTAQKAGRAVWMSALQAGADLHRERVNANLSAGRVWTDERREAWKAKAKTVWTPEKREAARQRAIAQRAAKAVGESQHDDTNATK